MSYVVKSAGELDLTKSLQYRLLRLFPLVFLTLPVGSEVKNYNVGQLRNVAMEDVSIPFTLDKTTLPISIGTMYKFDITSEGVNYVAACFSRKKRGCASDWTVNDAIPFRVHDDKLFLRRSNGKELRLLVLMKMRDSDQGTATSSAPSDQLKPSRHTIPDCQ